MYKQTYIKAGKKMKWLHLHWVNASLQDSSAHSPINHKQALTLIKKSNY